MTDTDAIRARHVPHWEGDKQVCSWEDCENDWPCDAHQLGVALEKQTAVYEEARDAYRTALRLRIEQHEAAEAREQRLRDLIRRHGYVYYGTVFFPYPVDLSGSDGIVEEPTPNEWLAALATEADDE